MKKIRFLPKEAAHEQLGSQPSKRQEVDVPAKILVEFPHHQEATEKLLKVRTSLMQKSKLCRDICRRMSRTKLKEKRN